MKRPSTTDEHGLAALAFVLVLLFTMSLALLWTGRSLIFEQRAAANQQRQAVAFAAAESGLGWAIARLNDARPIDAACQPSSSAQRGSSFRERYAAPWVAAPRIGPLDRPAAGAPEAASSGYAPPAALRASCRVGEAELACACHSSPTASTGDDASFDIELTPVQGEARALWVVARACSAGRSGCDAARGAQTEAQAVLRVKLRPVGEVDELGEAEVLRSAPLAIVPGSWRDGHCTSTTTGTPCGFEP